MKTTARKDANPKTRTTSRTEAKSGGRTLKQAKAGSRSRGASPKALARSASAARVQAKALAKTARREQERLEEATAKHKPMPRAELVEVFKEFNDTLERMAGMLAVEEGVAVEQAAERLGVSGTTVRKWVRHGLLARVPMARPMRVSDDSLLELEDAFTRVRDTFPEREWPKALAAYLHDRALLGQESVQAGIRSLRDGRVTTLVK